MWPPAIPTILRMRPWPRACTTPARWERRVSAGRAGGGWVGRRWGRRGATILPAPAATAAAIASLPAGGTGALRPVLHARQQQHLPSFGPYPRRWLTTGHGAVAAQHTVGRL